MRNLEDQCKRDCAANHTTVHDEEKFFEIDRLLTEAETEQVECPNDGNDTPNNNDGELPCDEAKTPELGDTRVKRDADIAVDGGFGCLAEEFIGHCGRSFALWGQVVPGVVRLDNCESQQRNDSGHFNFQDYNERCDEVGREAESSHQEGLGND